MFKLSTGDRMHRWKQFRSQLNELPLGEALQSTLDLWHSCPFIPFYLEADNPGNWPNPWELIEENYYCDLAKVLGIVYTLYLTEHKNFLDPEIRVYYDSKNRTYYHIAWFAQGKYVLNLVEGEIVNKEQINKELKLKHRYTAADLKLEQY